MPHSKPPVLVFGAGAHSGVLIEALQLSGRTVLDWLIDDNTALHGTTLNGREVRPADTLAGIDPATVELVNAVGSAHLPRARRAVYERFHARGFRFATAVHPSAVISPSATIAEGAQLMAGAVVQTRAAIGVNTLLNTRASIDHDCIIGGHCHLAPGVTLSGNVTVGDGCHLGTGAVVIQGVTIGEHAFIAAGSVVTRDLPPNADVRGVPAKPRD